MRKSFLIAAFFLLLLPTPALAWHQSQEPSNSPSAEPSEEPSISAEPSEEPSQSITPSEEPSAPPSATPSESATITPAPSVSPRITLPPTDTVDTTTQQPDPNLNLIMTTLIFGLCIIGFGWLISKILS